jgi:hypothetical protein
VRGRIFGLAQVFKGACAAFALLMFNSLCYAQSCALCYTQAASAGSRIIHGLRSGILVLIIPPMFMSVGITVLAYRKRNQFNRSDSSDSVRDGW